jgi:TRAP-type C4-dicarboxylate transport system substrate-binding protein
MKRFIIPLLALLLSTPLLAKTTLKFATIIPDDAAWTINLKKFAKEVAEKTGGRVTVKLYTGGVQGDEPDILRKIRVGQLHGGILTGTAMGSIYSDVRILEVPFNFIHDRNLAVKTLNGMTPYLEEGFSAKGFKILGFYEQGKIYVISKNRITTLDEMKKSRFWAFEGDEVIATMLKSLEMVPVNLPLTDVLTSLSTGLIDTAVGPPLGIISLQWHTRTKYLVNFPAAYGFGALVLSQKVWNEIDKKDQPVVAEIAKKYVLATNEDVNTGSEEALQSMKKMGMEFVEMPASEIEKAKKVGKEVISKLTGKMFTPKTVDAFNKSMNAK